MRRPGIPGTINTLNREVMAVLTNWELTPRQRADLAAALITAKVLAAYRIGERT